MKKLFYIPFFLVVTTMWCPPVDAQIQEKKFTFETDKPQKMLEEENEEPIVTKKKKRKPKVFYGIKTKKGFTQKGFGERALSEIFYYLKKPDEPNRFVRELYWYDFTRREVRKTRTYDPNKGALLHGPYKKIIQDNTVLEEGLFYKGAKHGRWMIYNRKNLLEDKKKYYKGWPKESLIVYFDPKEKKQVKEIIPIENEEREGHYYRFHRNGTVRVVGKYKWGKRIGEWVESYPTGQRKKIIVYPKEPFDNNITPFISKEWNEKGKELYTNKKR